MQLHADKRQIVLYQAVPPCHRLADIGTDHGKLPAMLLQNGVCREVVLADISAASLQKAKDLFHALGLEGTFVVSDGLEQINTDLDCIVIAGMGSNTICSILDDGKAKLGNATLVLGPNLKEEETRAFLHTIGYCVSHEFIVQANHKIYSVIVAKPSTQKLGAKELYIGKIQGCNRPEDIHAYLRKKEKALCIRLQGLAQSQGNHSEERQQLEEQLSWVKEELEIIC